jgi:hypothetical protein
MSYTIWMLSDGEESIMDNYVMLSY